MELIVANARLPDGGSEPPVDIGIAGGRIVAIGRELPGDVPRLDVGGRLVGAGLVDSHVHLDKSCIMDRCRCQRGDLAEAIELTARAKAAFTTEDVAERARRTLERCILHGTTRMRTHVEVDPGIGLRGFEGVRPLVAEYAWAIDLEICVFPQEGLLNNPGTEELMVAALRAGATVVGGAPYTDSDPHGQIERLFALARTFDADLDLHLDFSLDPADLDLLQVCAQAERHGRGGRVTIGHVSKLSMLPPAAFDAAARRLADAGVALTVLPATDLYLMARDRTHAVPRGVTPAHALLDHGVVCSLATNNVLNPFTPFGDGSLLRMANLYAHVCQAGTAAELRQCFEMVTTLPARLMNLRDYGIAVGAPADLIVLDAATPEQAVAELAPVLHAFKRGQPTVTRSPASLHRP